MKFGNPVDGMTGGQTEIRHADFPVGNDGHIVDFSHIPRIAEMEVGDQAAVDFTDDGIYTGKQRPKHMFIPPFQGFTHHRVVGIGNGFFGGVPGFIPSKTIFIHQQTHEFRHTQCRVGIVDVDCRKVGKV